MAGRFVEWRLRRRTGLGHEGIPRWSYLGTGARKYRHSGPFLGQSQGEAYQSRGRRSGSVPACEMARFRIHFFGKTNDAARGCTGEVKRPVLALQLHFPLEVSAASVGLVGSPPERPCENAVDRDAPLSELDSDATDFLDRPADHERCLVCRRGGVFLGAESALA